MMCDRCEKPWGKVPIRFPRGSYSSAKSPRSLVVPVVARITLDEAPVITTTLPGCLRGRGDSPPR
jgi:hypothetical protein